MDQEQAFPFPAFLAAVLSGIGIWVVGYCAYAVVTEGPSHATWIIPYLVLGGLLFGAPLAAALVLLVAYPALFLLRRTIGVGLPAVLVTGAVCGLLVRVVVGILWAEPEIRFVPVPVALVAGLAAAGVWWRSWRRPPSLRLRGRGTI